MISIRLQGEKVIKFCQNQKTIQFVPSYIYIFESSQLFWSELTHFDIWQL